jgi:DNA modification methylase
MIKINQVYHGNCLELINLIDDKSIDMILCDLPYGQTAQEWDSILPMDVLWEQYKRILKEDCVMVFTASQPFTTMLISSNISDFKYCWYWKKNQGTNFFHAKRMPIRKIEEIVVFGGKRYYPQITDGHKPTNSAKGCSSGKIYHGTNKRNYDGGQTTRYPINYLEINCVNNYKKLHPNEKPVKLFEYLIKTYSIEGDLILDNCCGSGTTGIACKNTNRNFILMEKETKYFEIAKKRISSYL